ncbi:MAG: hypothetical protein ACMUJM_05480 [bacterium]
MNEKAKYLILFFLVIYMVMMPNTGGKAQIPGYQFMQPFITADPFGNLSVVVPGNGLLEEIKKSNPYECLMILRCYPFKGFYSIMPHHGSIFNMYGVPLPYAFNIDNILDLIEISCEQNYRYILLMRLSDPSLCMLSLPIPPEDLYNMYPLQMPMILGTPERSARSRGFF